MDKIKESIKEYISRQDWRVNANANQGYSVGGMILNTAGKAVGNLWLDDFYTKEIADLHREGDFYIHDLDMLTGYCAGWSLKDLLREGFNGVAGKISSKPPKHLSTALGQMLNFLGTLQNEWAGAQAFSSFDTLLAPFVYVDKMDYETLVQHLQEFVFNLNVPTRWGTQTPFTNLTFDLTCPADLKDQPALVGGKEIDKITGNMVQGLLLDIKTLTYGDFQKEMDMINRAFCEVMSRGDSEGRIFTFPIPTYNVTPDFPWDSEVANAIFKMTAKYGVPYFSNFINSDMKPEDVRSMCCRLRLDLTELKKRNNGLFGSGEQTGSIGVVTLNMARLGYLKDFDSEFFDRLNYLLEMAKESLVIKRRVITDFLERGLYPYTKRYLPAGFRNHFNTIGVNGVNEMLEIMTNGVENMTTIAGQKMAKLVLDYINETLIRFQEETGVLFNLEATPAEGATYRLALSDKKKFDSEYVYYTNSTQLPVNFTTDPFKAAEYQQELQSKYTGGTVLHLYLEEQIKDPEMCKQLVKKVLTNTTLPYITVTPTFSVCAKHGYKNGKQEVCPDCGEATEVWSRVMGYFRPFESYNTGKKHEHTTRTLMKLEGGK